MFKPGITCVQYNANQNSLEPLNGEIYFCLVLYLTMTKISPSLLEISRKSMVKGPNQKSQGILIISIHDSHSFYWQLVNVVINKERKFLSCLVSFSRLFIEKYKSAVLNDRAKILWTQKCNGCCQSGTEECTKWSKTFWSSI